MVAALQVASGQIIGHKDHKPEHSPRLLAGTLSGPTKNRYFLVRDSSGP